jgi:transcriptional regulator with XRE-family HTH domain
VKKMTFGEIIKQKREESKISQAALAKRIKKQYNVRISTSYLSMIETNARTNLTVNLINALMEHLDLPMEAAHSLLTGSKQSAKHDAAPDVKTAYETQIPYTGGKDVNQLTKFNAKLPPEVEEPLEEIYNLLVAKYAQD